MIKKLLFTSALGFLACNLNAQVAHVTWKSSAHYNSKVKEFEQMRPIESTDIVMLGNSLTEFGGDWNLLLRTKNVRNRGIMGDTAEGIYHRLNQILPGHPKALFLMCGVNDISHGLTPQQIFQRIKRLIDTIRRESPSTKLYVQSCLPINETTGRWKLLVGKTDDVPVLNGLIADYCRKNNIEFVNLFDKFTRHGTNSMRLELTTDGIHLSKVGYKIWSFELRKYVKEDSEE